MEMETATPNPAENVGISTATISVRILQVNDRKMTLSVFRQIPEEDLIDSDTHELKGEPWGWVNYFWEGQQGDMNVLWLKNGQLRRCVLSKLHRLEYYVSYDTRAARRMEHRVRDGIRVEVPWPDREAPLPSNKLWFLRSHLQDTGFLAIGDNGRVCLRLDADVCAEMRKGLAEWNAIVEQVRACGQLFIAV